MADSASTQQHNFFYPVTTLTGSDFYLEPFDSSLHAQAYWDASGPDPNLYKYMSIGPYTSKEHFIDGLVRSREEDKGKQLYAIMTTRQHAPSSPPTSTSTSTSSSTGTSTTTPTIAGLAGYLNTLPSRLSIEIGPLIILPSHQRLSLAVDITTLLTRHALTLTSQGGFGMRRVIYSVNPPNVGSSRVAEKCGFTRESVQRWDMVLWDGVRKGKVGNGRGVPPGAGEGDIGRDTVVWVRCFDD